MTAPGNKNGFQKLAVSSIREAASILSSSALQAESVRQLFQTIAEKGRGTEIADLARYGARQQEVVAARIRRKHASMLEKLSKLEGCDHE